MVDTGQTVFGAFVDAKEKPASDVHDDDVVPGVGQQRAVQDANILDNNCKSQEYGPSLLLTAGSMTLHDQQHTLAIAAQVCSPTTVAAHPQLTRHEGQLRGQKGENEAHLIPQDRLTTRDLQRVEERISSTHEIKDRLGPMVERLKASMVKIQSLEDSLQLGKDNSTSDHDGNSKSTSWSTSLIPSEHSRRLMHQGMEMVKNKLLMLQNLEDRLTFSEDRRHNLQHHFLQASLSQPLLELSATRLRNSELHDRIEELEHEAKRWKKKASLVDDLHLRSMTLRGQLHEVNMGKGKVEDDLGDQQTVIQQQAIRCDDLECLVEHLTMKCDELRGSLRQQEDRNASLEEELLDTRKHMRDRQRSRSAGPPRTIQAQGSRGSSTTASTCPTAASDSLNDVSGDNMSSGCSSTGSDDNASSTSMGEGSSSTQHGMAINVEGGGEGVANVDNHRKFCDSCNDSDDMTAGDDDTASLHQDEVLVGRSDDPDAIMIQTLVAKIEALDRENAELRDSKDHAFGKFKALSFEMKTQASTIRELQKKVKHQARLLGTGQNGKGPIEAVETEGGFFTEQGKMERDS